MIFEVTNAGTRYRLHRVVTMVHQYFLAETGWGNGYGEWIILDTDSIAWSYIAEKMPSLRKYGGDKPGWIMVFEKAGIKVFG